MLLPRLPQSAYERTCGVDIAVYFELSLSGGLLLADALLLVGEVDGGILGLDV
jgi:hypothetical protein